MAEPDPKRNAASPSKSRSILIVLSTGHVALRELRPVVEHFHTSGWRVVLRLGASGREANAAVAMFRDKGMDAEIIPPGIGYGEAEQVEARSEVDELDGALPIAAAPEPNRVREAMKRALRPFLVHRAVAFWRYFRAALRRRRWATALLEARSVDAVLMNMFHSVGEIDNALQWAARRVRIPLFCLTNSSYVGEAIHLVARMNHLQSGMSGPEIRADYDPINRLLAAMFPSWTRLLPNGVRAFYWDPVRIVAGKLAGLGMNRMWIKPSVDFDRVFLFDAFSRDLLLESGYPSDRIQVAGQPLFDDILRHRDDPARQTQIASHIDVARGERFLLVNIEPSFEHSYATKEAHWRNFRSVMGACSGHGVKVVLSLHPLCDIENYRFAEHEYGCRISTRFFIHELYPDCTVSVSFPCSTNVLSLKFGVPLVIYDFHDVLERDSVTDRLFKLPGALVGKDEQSLRVHIATLVRESTRTKGSTRPEDACTFILNSVAAGIARSKP